MSTMEPANKYVPRVTKSLVKGPEPDYSKVVSFRFKDSDTLICVIHGLLHISFNNGGSWEIANAFKNRLICFVGVDLFHKGRAFVATEGEKNYVTEDQGKTWKELYFSKEPDEFIECLQVRTHPTDRRLLVFHVETGIYVSDNAGESIKRLPPSVNYHGAAPISENHICNFAVSSKESTLDHNGIYYIHNARYAELGGERVTCVSTLSYTADFGKTARTFEELNGFFLKDIFTFPSTVIVLASDDQSGEKTKSLWISKGGHFELIRLPDEVAVLLSVHLVPLGQNLLSGYNQKQLLLNVRTNKDCEVEKLLLLDPLTLNFSWCSSPSSDDAPKYFKRLHNLRRILQGSFYLRRPPEHVDDCKKLVRFDDSDTLIFMLDGFLHISFNNGESWKVIDTFREGKVRYVDIDPFHKERAFVTSKHWKIHVTEDRGRRWRELRTLKFHDFNPPRIRSHPIDRKLLLLSTWTDGTEEAFFVSDDTGESFKQVECYECHFAVSSKESTLENNGIYYCHEDTLFYTSDFGKTTRTFHELNGFSIEKILVFPSSVFVLTSKGDERDRMLWISRGQVFKPLSLPDEVISLKEAYVLSLDYCPGYDQRQLFLNVKVKDHCGWRMLILDVLNLNFSLRGSAVCCCGACLEQVGNLKGTFRNISWRDSIDSETKVKTTVYIMKLSFDAGKSWKNLKVIDPSGKHRHLFEGDIEDMEKCSFQISFDRLFGSYEPTAGILMEVGTVEQNYASSNGNDMTFISRDGGASWEVAFEFPVYAAFLDYGNIIVALPTEKSNLYTKFFFSLDQGRTWDEYHFREPISGGNVQIHSLGLRALIGIRKKKTSPVECLFYSLDFSNIFGEATCTEDDLERWYLYDGKCIDGVRYSFDRRKADAKCLVSKTFRNLELHEERDES